MSLKRIWNGRFGGIPSAAILFFKAACMRVADRISTIIWVRSLAACGYGTRILWRPIIRNPGQIFVGRGVILARGVNLSAEIDTGKLIIEDNVWVGEETRIDFSGSVLIGEGSTLSPGVQIFTHSHGSDPRSVPEGYELKIGKNVWIGVGAVILQNVRELPDNCIIGARAVVTRKPESGEILAGNPAKVINKSADS